MCVEDLRRDSKYRMSFDLKICVGCLQRRICFFSRKLGYAE